MLHVKYSELRFSATQHAERKRAEENMVRLQRNRNENILQVRDVIGLRGCVQIICTHAVPYHQQQPMMDDESKAAIDVLHAECHSLLQQSAYNRIDLGQLCGVAPTLDHFLTFIALHSPGSLFSFTAPAAMDRMEMDDEEEM